jgi:phosphate:Na+ symporter
MGANIGTTVTAWIISALGFKVDIAAFALPLLTVGVVMLFMQKSKYKSMGEFIMGFCFLFMGLSYLKANAPDLQNNPEMLAFVQDYANMGFMSILLFVLIGTVLTMIVQASAATMAITLIMCANGWISFELGAALVLGENIGTTITANLAAITGNTQSRRAALAHLVFNVFGVIWVLCLFTPFTNAVTWIVENWMGITDNGDGSFVSFQLSAFHTCFNVCNVLLLIWLVKFIEKTVCKILPTKESDEDTRLRFITGGLLSTAELSILEAQKEISLYAQRTHKMFGFVQELLNTKKGDEFNKLFSRIEKYESISDNMEVEIAHYLNQVSEGRLSAESKAQIQNMLREVTEIESVGDSCYNLARTLSRKRQNLQEDFTEKQYEHIQNMMNLADEAMEQMVKVVDKSSPQHIDVNKSYNIENEINNYRNQLKNQNIIDVNNKMYDYQIGVYYMDIIAECEKLGDYIVNVIEATGAKEK